MSEQVTCHKWDSGDGLWDTVASMNGKQKKRFMLEGYCPICGTKLLPDGTEQAMVPADALHKLAQVMSSEDICPAGTVLEHEIHCHKGEDGDCNTAEMQACIELAAIASTNKAGGKR